jgi:predicted esterase
MAPFVAFFIHCKPGNQYMRLLCESLEADSHSVYKISFSDGAMLVLHVLSLLP